MLTTVEWYRGYLLFLRWRLDSDSDFSQGKLTPLFLLFKVTELKHLQCLAEELKSLEEVLKLYKSKNSDVEDLMSNINVTVLGLKVRAAMVVWDSL